jgi:hypothetical protein
MNGKNIATNFFETNDLLKIVNTFNKKPNRKIVRIIRTPHKIEIEDYNDAYKAHGNRNVYSIYGPKFGGWKRMAESSKNVLPVIRREVLGIERKYKHDIDIDDSHVDFNVSKLDFYKSKYKNRKTKYITSVSTFSFFFDKLYFEGPGEPERDELVFSVDIPNIPIKIPFRDVISTDFRLKTFKKIFETYLFDDIPVNPNNFDEYDFIVYHLDVQYKYVLDPKYKHLTTKIKVIQTRRRNTRKSSRRKRKSRKSSRRKRKCI